MTIRASLIRSSSSGKHLQAEGAQGGRPGFAFGDFGDPLVRPVEDVPERELQQGVLGGEVRLQGAVGEACLQCDLPHGGALDAQPGDDPPGGIHQFQAPLVMVNNLWHRGRSPEIFSLKPL